MNFHYGQRVRCIDVADGNSSVIGQTGTVRSFTLNYSEEEEEEIRWPGIEFDEEIVNGHALDDHETGKAIAWGCGWYCPPETLIPLFESVNIEELI